MNASALRHVLVFALAISLSACNGQRAPNSDSRSIQSQIDQDGTVAESPGDVKPDLEGVTLRIGDSILRPVGDAVAFRRAISAGDWTVYVKGAEITAIRTSDDKPLWSTESSDGSHLRWLNFKETTGFLIGYRVNEHGQFEEYTNPGRIRRIDLKTGRWLKEITVGADATVKELLSVKVSGDDLAILAALTAKGDAGAADGAVAAYQVTCFRGDELTRLWTTKFDAEEERGYGGVLVWGITPPAYAHSDNQHLVWVEEMLLVAAEDMQPIRALNRETGSTIWEVEKIWEYDRGFIGPSVYSHYIGRFGMDDRFDVEESKKSVEAARKAFNEQFTCAVIGGPAVVPLKHPRGSDSHSIFVAVSRGPTRGWSGYLADCVVYELNEKGTPISIGKLPQLVSGGKLKILEDGLVWAGQNDSFVKLLPSRRQPLITMGGGGGDLTTRLAWFRQAEWEPPLAWLTTGRAAEPVSFNQSSAFRLPGGGYVANKGDREYKFPIGMLNLSSGVERELVLNVPFDSAIPPPDTNYESTPTSISCGGFYLMAITNLHASDDSLEVTLGMEDWSATLTFDLKGAQLARAANHKKQERDYSSRISLLTSPEMLAEELRKAGHGNDVEYVKALLKAGADPLDKSKFGWTALMVAACYGSADIVDVLIAAESDVNAQDGNCGGQTVLMWATRSGQQSARKVKALLKAGANIEGKTFSGEWTALMSAVADDNLAVVELLLAKGASLDVRDKDGHGPLRRAKDRGNEKIAEILERHGAKE